MIDGSSETVTSYIDEKYFDLDSMRKKNRESLYLDGIESVENGILTYTDQLIEKCRNAFGISLMKQVGYDEIEKAAQFLIKEVIEKNL